ncbi:peptide deformylase [Deinococcota bacterium DY0809b]
MAEVLPVRLYGDPVLRRKARPVQDFSDLEELAENMVETMFEYGGVGLAAPQVGLSRRLFVAAEYELEEEEAEADEEERPRSVLRNLYVMVNPRITYREGTQVGTEGCLSIPGVYSDDVPRNLQIRVEYQDVTGAPRTLEAEGYLARVIQHELDHLEGVLFLDRIPAELRRAFLEEHRAELAEMQRKAKAFLRELQTERG